MPPNNLEIFMVGCSIGKHFQIITALALGSEAMNISLEYIAGFFDGEGCVRAVLAKNRENAAGLHVFITNTYLPILKHFEQRFGGTVSLRNVENPKHKTTYQWRISNRKGIKNFLEQISPFLIEKKEQALLALEYC